MNDGHAKTKVVFLTDCLAGLAGGAERQILELAGGLDKKKYDITIASLECEGRAPRDLVESAGCRLAAFPVKRVYGLSGILEGFRFVRLLKQNRTDILMTYHFSSDIWGAVTGKIAGVPIIISNRRDMGFWRGRRHVLAYKMINRYARKIVVNARAAKELFMREENIPEQKFEVIYNGVGLQDTRHKDTRHKTQDTRAHDARLKKSLGIKNDDVVIAHVANIKPVKGHVYLLKAFAETAARHPKARLLLIGEDKLNGRMHALAEELGVTERVLFLGKRDDVVSLLRLADICVLPSLSEGMSNAILEYMAAGKPVVATRVGGNPELIEDGVNGLLVEKEDVGSLKAALSALMGDPKKRAAMGKNSLQRVGERFSLRQMVDNYERLFDSLLPKQKTILHLISSGGLFGAENIVLTLGRNIQDDLYRSVIGVLHDPRRPEPEVAEKARAAGVETYILKCNGRFDAVAVLRLRKYLADQRIGILHTHNYKSDAIGALAARLAGVPLAATAHGFTDMTRAVSFYEKLDRWVLRSCFKKVVTVADDVLKGFPDQKKSVIPNGVDIGQFAGDGQKRTALRKKLNVGDDDVLIGAVGRLSREKNQKMLLDALYPVMREQDHVKVMIVGDGPKMDELRQFAEARHLADRIMFTGIIRDMTGVYSAMDIFVLSSLTEGVPLTVLEAMAARVPVIATRVGGVPEIIRDDDTGLLVDPRDTDALRVKIESLLNDHGKRQRLAASGFEFVKENYSLGRMCDAYRRVYGEVLAG